MSRGLPKNVKNLLEKARESALLAVDVYNKPKTSFRTGGFIVLMHIAWTSLLHAVFEKQGIKYFYKSKSKKRYAKIDGDYKAWDLNTSIQQFIDIETDPMRKNLEFFIKLRNKIEHRFMPEIDSYILGESQAYVLNFETVLVREFDEKYSIVESFFIPLQLIKTTRKIPVTKAGEQVLEFIKQYRESLSSSISNNENFSYKLFIIPKVGNHQSSSDAAVEFIKVDSNSQEQIDLLNKFVIAVKDKQVANNNSHPLRPGQIITLIEEKAGVKKTIHWHTKMYKKYNVRDSTDSCNTQYCNYHIASKIYSYNYAWVDLLIDNEVAT